MATQIKISFSDEDAKWLKVAKAAGFNMSSVVRGLAVEPGQHAGLASEVESLVRRRIERMNEEGCVHEAQRLQNLIEVAQYPVGYY